MIGVCNLEKKIQVAVKFYCFPDKFHTKHDKIIDHSFIDLLICLFISLFTHLSTHSTRNRMKSSKYESIDWSFNESVVKSLRYLKIKQSIDLN